MTWRQYDADDWHGVSAVATAAAAPNCWMIQQPYDASLYEVPFSVFNDHRTPCKAPSFLNPKSNHTS